MVMGSSKQEPTALNRAAAREMRDMYVALVDEGFTEDEALKLLAHMLKNAAGAAAERDDD